MVTVDLKLENLHDIIYSCFVLYNYCEQNKIGINQILLENQTLRHDEYED